MTDESSSDAIYRKKDDERLWKCQKIIVINEHFLVLLSNKHACQVGKLWNLIELKKHDHNFLNSIGRQSRNKFPALAVRIQVCAFQIVLTSKYKTHPQLSCCSVSNLTPSINHQREANEDVLHARSSNLKLSTDFVFQIFNAHFKTDQHRIFFPDFTVDFGQK